MVEIRIREHDLEHIDDWLSKDFEEAMNGEFVFLQGSDELGCDFYHALPITKLLAVAIAKNKVEAIYEHNPHLCAGGVVLRLRRINGNITKEDEKGLVLYRQEFFDKQREESKLRELKENNNDTRTNSRVN